MEKTTEEKLQIMTVDNMLHVFFKQFPKTSKLLPHLALQGLLLSWWW